MPTVRNVFDLYTRTPSLFFRRDQAEGFAAELRLRATATSVRAFSTVADLQLLEDGTTRSGGYRLTRDAFRKVAALCGTGLSHFLAELAGVVRTARNANDAVDGRLARYVWNNMIDLRATTLSPYRLLCDTRNRTLDSLVGGSYHMPSNHDVFQAAVDALRGPWPTMQFYAGSLVGRTMVSWFREPTAWTRIGELAFYRGYYVAAAELTGYAARITPAIFFKHGTCLAPFKLYGRKISAIGHDDARRRVALGFGDAVAMPFPDSQVRHGAALLERNLGFVPTPDPRLQAGRISLLTGLLVRAGLPRGVAQETVALALSTGRYVGDAGPAALNAITKTYAERTFLDLLVPLCHLARQTSIRRRETFEQVAFGIVVGGLHLPSEKSHDTSVRGNQEQAQRPQRRTREAAQEGHRADEPGSANATGGAGTEL